MPMKKKFDQLSAGLQKYIVEEAPGIAGKSTIAQDVKKSKTPVSSYAERVLRHCNGGATLQSALWLKEHLKTVASSS